MNLGTLLAMTRSAHTDRVAIGARTDGLTYGQLASMAVSAARRIVASGARSLVFVGVNSPAWPVSLFAAAIAKVAVVPLNYRLHPDRLAALAGRVPDPFVVADDRYLSGLRMVFPDAVESRAWCGSLLRDLPDDEVETALEAGDADGSAVILFTSGTTSEPKGVVLRHGHLVSYVLQTVEFGAADEGEAALVSVPPYHVAGVGTVLTNAYAGRRLVYLPDFTPRSWLETVRTEGITQAMVVPTMLARIVEEFGGERAHTPTLRSIAYGGATMPRRVLVEALHAFPDTGFVNSYGLTETSSTIAVLGPEDHRAALASDDPVVAARLGSAGRAVPGIELEVRTSQGGPARPGQIGDLWVRGDQVSAEYMEQGRAVDENGWFATRDRAYIDPEGYLFIVGRADDTIIRGGENIAPAEIEAALREHDCVADAVVVGLPDEEWGQRIVAVVVRMPGATLTADDVRGWVRARLRGSRTPDDVVFTDELPYSPLGKLARRDVVDQVTKLLER